MGYILAEILACIFIAGLFGIFIGWWLRGSNKESKTSIDEEKKAFEKELSKVKDEYEAKLKSEQDFYSAKINEIELSCKKQIKRYENELEKFTAKNQQTETIKESNIVAEINDPNEKCYELEDIQGIGPGFALRLKKRGVFNSCFLAKKFLFDDEATKRMSQKLDIDFDTIKAWASMADLMKIEGISSEFAETLQAIGIKTRQDLMFADPYHLFSELSSYKRKYPNGPDIPDISIIKSWVDRLKAT